MRTTFSFTRRLTDHVSDELAAVLSTPTAFEFKTLFTEVYSNLRKRNATSGGEEMLRLRTYEKLQNFVKVGIVQRTGKEYKGIAPALAAFKQESAEMKAKLAAGTLFRAPSLPAVTVMPTPAKAKTAKKAGRKTPALRRVP